MCPTKTDDEAIFGTAQLDSRGRLEIPAALRDELQLEEGTSFTVIREGRDIRLVRQLPELRTLTTGYEKDEWRGIAFRDAGDATFGGQ